MSRYTYFAFCKKTNTMKIGSSESPRDRVKQIVERPRLILAIEDEKLSEKAAHEMFGALRVIGEWFAVTPAMVVQTLKFMGVPFLCGNRIPGTRAQRAEGKSRSGKRTIQVVVTDEEFAALKALSVRERRTLSSQLTVILQEKLDRISAQPEEATA